MNYRHAYHAGNFADVFKHAILVLVIEHLRRKDTPFAVLDTHAGTGLYDLSGAESTRTGEHAAGIGRLLRHRPTGAAEALAGYLALVKSLNPTPDRDALAGTVRPGHYPGSPWIARHLMRPQDRLIACELHPEDARTLRSRFAGDRRVAVHHMDGYAAVKAHLPPAARRGLVLMDPPYETPDEAARLVAALALGHRRFPTGIFLLWYPIKDPAAGWRFHESLVGLGIPDILAAELTITTGDDPNRLNGCGMAIVNPPWRLETTLATLLPTLQAALAADAGGTRITRLVPDSAPVPRNPPTPELRIRQEHGNT